MELSVLCLLTVALAFGPLHSAHGVPSEKPGVCPRLILPFTDRRLCQRPCTSDSDCPGILKCCFSACGRVCLKPERVVPEPKPGSCPRPNRFGTCVNSCSSDSDCEKDLKCCSNGCGRVCMKPVRVVPEPKPGSCPRPNRFGTCVNSCSSDSDCEKDLKCCSNGCGRVCMKPVREPVEKPGVCPGLILEFEDLSVCPMQCTSDSDCEKDLKCCFGGCGRTCMKPVRVVPEPKPGSCPRPNHFGTCVNSCSSDSDCEKDLKCCSNGCGRVCMKPVREPVEKPGVCPGLILEFEDLSVCPMQCTSDSDCEKDLKCCFGGCGRTCMKPVRVPVEKPGVCPIRIIWLSDRSLCPMQCTSDSDCKGILKCCSSGCGRTCEEPERETYPGSCPQLGNCDRKCTVDSQCDNNLRCCHNQCGRRMCMEPVAGLCPRLHFKQCKDECSEDSQCEKPLKCCYNQCERRRTCMKPAEPKPGTCPRPIPHIKPCDNDCSDDHQCPINLKCCYSGCGNKCMRPLIWRG